ncbi:MAG: AAA family ATPase [Bilophila wadsworthia]
MKKQLILVGGAMGVGKSAVCRELLRQLTPGVWLDGDWCWNMNPFVVSEENKRMVLSNITHLLRAYLNNSSYRYVLFCWVMDQPLLFEAVLGPLRDIPFTLHSFSLVCTEQVLRERLERDVRDGIREADVIPRSLRRLPAYAALPTCKLDVTSLTPYEAACAIAASVGRRLRRCRVSPGPAKAGMGPDGTGRLGRKRRAFRQQRRKEPSLQKGFLPPFSSSNPYL